MKRFIFLATLAFLTISCKTVERPCVYSYFAYSGSGSLSADPMSQSYDWSSVPAATLSDSLKNDNVLEMRSVWTEDTLYFRFDMSDTRLWGVVEEHDGLRLWRDDIVEFLIDAQNHHTSGWTTDDIIFHYNVRGYLKDDRGTEDFQSDKGWNSTGRYKVIPDGTICDNSDIDKGYTLLAAVPWTEIGRVPEVGIAIGFAYGYVDNDGEDRGHDAQVLWCGPDPARSPEMFGELRLYR